MTRTRRRRSPRRRDTIAAVVALVPLVLIIALAFGLIGVGGGDRTVHATFASANGLKARSEVRIAGVKIGEVHSLDPGPRNTTTIAIRLNDTAPPLYANATMRVKPRLVLEGNFYIDVDPGTPAAPELGDGRSLPIARTSIPVQLDQVIDLFDHPARTALHDTVKGLGGGLGGAPSGAGGLRSAVRELDGALGDITTAARAVQGVRPGDLRSTISDSAELTRQLAADPRALADLVSNSRRLTGALAAHDTELQAGIRELSATLRLAPGTLASLDRALPVTERFADALRPALEHAPKPLGRATALLEQLTALSQPKELPGALADLRPATTQLPALQTRLKRLTPGLNTASQCLDTHVGWMLDQELDDGKTSSGDPVYLDLVHAFAGASSSLGGFDGNGVGFRAGIAAGPAVLKGVIPGLGSLGTDGGAISGVRPTWLGYGVEPPYRPDAPCADQGLPDLSKRSGGPPATQKGGG